ncbi:zinc finger protein [Saccharopolyspora tripterygii]
MYPFHWVPTNASRHASTDRRPAGTLAYPTGTAVSTLCGLAGQVADNSELAWLWPSCPECYRAAVEIARATVG